MLIEIDSPNDDQDLKETVYHRLADRKLLLRMIPDKVKLMKMYLKHNGYEKSWAKSTYQAAYYSILKFFVFLYANFENKSLEQVRTKDFLIYKEMLIEHKLSHETVKILMMHIKVFFTYLKSKEIVSAEIEWPTIKSGRAKHSELSICHPETVMKVRKVSGVKLQWVALFEMLLSTGMRIGEATAIRCCDIDFNAALPDVNTGSNVGTVGGSIALNANIIKIKNNRSRIVYFSKNARKYLEQYMHVMRFDTSLATPVFPWSATGFTDCLRSLKVKINFDSRDLQLFNKHNINIKPGNARINFIPDVKRLPKSRQKFLARQRASYEEKRKEFAAGNEITIREVLYRKKLKSVLSPHSLRHTFAAMMYYRLYDNDRHNIEKVRRLMGHSRNSMSEYYLKSLDFLESDSQWKRLISGSFTDWPKIDCKSCLT